ncbi:hypothetical protein [Catenovulum agarivorans]|uniref:hypothetical protein n=1 Tax=Catenovulum agarivorans TaxID=1172192 RepID=UPI0002D87F50|nr:hypothetical protein [Catenovulum agarivorans]
MKFYEYAYKVYQYENQHITSKLKIALAWLDSLGISYSKTRIGDYTRKIEEFERIFDSNCSEEQIKFELQNVLNAHQELTEIIRIYSGLTNVDSEEYLAQLKKATSGQAFRNSAKSDQSRDFLFELTVASRFIQGGFHVTLNHTADIVANKANYPTLYVECKRIKSPAKLEVNIKKASEQLRKRLLNGGKSSSRGMIAINVNDVINPQNDFVIVDNVELFQKAHSYNLDLFVRENESKFNAKKLDKCLGVMIEQTMQAYIVNRDPNATVNCRGVKFYQYSTKKSDLQFIDELSKSLANQNSFS